MLTLTDSATEKIKQLTDDKPAALRIEVVRGPHGCVHGWNFAIDPASADGNETVYESAGVRIVADPETVPMIEEAAVDYREDATAVGFTIKAPQAGHSHGGSGGCGNH